MKICKLDGLSLVLMTRDEHCPPHLHVEGANGWTARFQFSFWHNNAFLWDVTPQNAVPGVPLTENLRLMLEAPANLRRAREKWWGMKSSVCLENLLWDMSRQTVFRSKTAGPDVRRIRRAFFVQQEYKTVLTLEGISSPLEIEL